MPSERIYRRRILKTVFAVVAAVSVSLLYGASAFAINFSPSPDSPITGLGEPGVGAVTGDFTDSPYPDIVSASTAADGVAGGGLFIQETSGDGAFTQTPNSPIGTNQGLTSIYAADLNGDGDSDTISRLFGNFFTINSTYGPGDLGFDGQFLTAGDVTARSMLSIGDVTGDGLPEIVSGASDSGFGVKVNTGGNFPVLAPPEQTVPGTPGNPGDTVRTVSIGDFNGDSHADLALGLEACTAAAVTCTDPDPNGNAIYIMEGDGTATGFTAAPGSPLRLPAGEIVSSSAVTSIAGTSQDSLAVGTRTANGSGEIHTFIGDEDDFLVVNPDESGSFHTDSPPMSLLSHDLSEDGHPDLAWLENGTKAGFLIQGTGGAYEPNPKSPLPIAPGANEFVTLDSGQFTEDPGASLVAGGNNSESGQGVVGVLLPAMDLVSNSDSVEFPSTKVTQASLPVPIDLKNSGLVAGEISSIELNGANPTEFKLPNRDDCLREIAAGANCNLDVTFTPDSAGEKVATLRVVGSANDLEINLSGTATRPVISATPGSLDFDEVPVGRSRVQEVTIGSTGLADAVFSSIVVAGAGSREFKVTNEDCTTRPQAPGETCRIEVTFSPGSAGVRSASLSIQSDAQESSLVLPLVGSGKVPEPQLSLNLRSPKKVKRGKKLKVTAVVKNLGATKVSALTLRATVPKSLARKVRTARIGALAPGATAKRVLVVTTRRHAKPGKKLRIKVTVWSSGKKGSTRSKAVIIR